MKESDPELAEGCYWDSGDAESAEDDAGEERDGQGHRGDGDDFGLEHLPPGGCVWGRTYYRSR